MPSWRAQSTTCRKPSKRGGSRRDRRSYEVRSGHEHGLRDHEVECWSAEAAEGIEPARRTGAAACRGRNSVWNRAATKIEATEPARGAVWANRGNIRAS